LYLTHDFLEVGEMRRAIRPPIADDSIFVEDQHGTLTGTALSVPQAIGATHLPFGLPV
jgi:hypothetical protein